MKRSKTIVKKINKLFNEAEVLYNRLPQQTKDVIKDFHNESYSLPHCIRWGLQASEELLEPKSISWGNP